HHGYPRASSSVSTARSRHIVLARRTRSHYRNMVVKRFKVTLVCLASAFQGAARFHTGRTQMFREDPAMTLRKTRFLSTAAVITVGGLALAGCSGGGGGGDGYDPDEEITLNF